MAHGAFTGQRVHIGLALGVGLPGIVDQQFQQLLSGQITLLADGVGVDQVVVVHKPVGFVDAVFLTGSLQLLAGSVPCGT